MTKMEMMIVEAWAGEQLLVISGTGVTMGEDLFEGQSWTMSAVTLITFVVVLLSWAGVVCYGHLPTGRTVTGEPEFAWQPRARTWSLSRYSGDQLWQLVEMLSTIASLLITGQESFFSEFNVLPVTSKDLPFSSE